MRVLVKEIEAYYEANLVSLSQICAKFKISISNAHRICSILPSYRIHKSGRQRRVTDEQIQEMKLLYSNGMMQKDIAAMMCISRTTVSQYITGARH